MGIGGIIVLFLSPAIRPFNHIQRCPFNYYINSNSFLYIQIIFIFCVWNCNSTFYITKQTQRNTLHCVVSNLMLQLVTKPYGGFCWEFPVDDWQEDASLGCILYWPKREGGIDGWMDKIVYIFHCPHFYLNMTFIEMLISILIWPSQTFLV